jgi:myo-inositol-1(or 4)-monophosphatase
VSAGLPDGAVAAALRAADAAGEILRHWFRQGLPAEQKSDASPVTRADREAETAIRSVLAEAFPEFGLLGEEFGDDRRGRFTWVIDPIDGTRAFITGRPSFATLISLMDGETPVLGLIDQPVLGERWLAAAGRLDFTGPLGGASGTRRIGRLAEAELSATTPQMFAGGLAPRFARLEAACRRSSWGDDAYAYGLLALGAIDVIAEADLKPWDWGALVPVVEAAGGVMTDWQGAPLRFGSDGTALALGDPALLEAAIAALQEPL